MPSPVATGGLVVSAKTCPAPPVASRVARASTTGLLARSRRESGSPPRALRCVTRSVEQAKERTSISGVRLVFSSSAADHLPARRVPQGVQDAVAGMRPLAREVVAPLLTVKAGPPGGQLADPLGPLLDQDAAAAGGGDARSRLQGVLEMLPGSSSGARATATPPCA